VGRGKKIVDIELVIDEAIALIEEGGVEEFSTRRLASRLGISAMTLYNYYENRGAIIGEALKRGLGMLWDGLPAEVSAWRQKGGQPLGVYRVLADHLLAFALEKPRLCRFVLTESAGIDWSDRDSAIERMLGSDDQQLKRSDELRRDIYLFELIVFALALKVISGGETADRYRDLSGHAFERLIGRNE